MEKVTARTNIECNVSCPHCGHYQNRLDVLREYFNHGEPRAEDIEAELKCVSCSKLFIVDLIEY